MTLPGELSDKRTQEANQTVAPSVPVAPPNQLGRARNPQPQPQPQVQGPPQPPQQGPPQPPQQGPGFYEQFPGTEQFPPELIQSQAQNTPGWTEAQMTLLEQMLQTYNYLDGKPLQDTMAMVMKNSDPSIVNPTGQRFQRQLGLSTQEMFEEQALLALMGITSDEEALSRAAVDTWYETHASQYTAAQVFANTENQKQTFTGMFLENPETRAAIMLGAAEAAWLADFVEKNGRQPVFTERRDRLIDPNLYSSEISGLRGKTLTWVRDGDALAMTWYDEDEDKPSVDVLIHLSEGTEITSSVDAVFEYLLTVDGKKNLLDPSSGKVPGRQTFIGALFEGMDDVLNSVERWGGGFLVNDARQAQTDISAGMAASTQMLGLPPINDEQAELDEKALAEQQQMETVMTGQEEAGIVAIARMIRTQDPDLSVSQAVTMGIAGWAEVPDDVKEASALESISDLQKAAAADQEEQSILGSFIEDDLAPPILAGLEAYNTMIQFMGTAAFDLTNLDAAYSVYQNVQENGVAGLLSLDTVGLMAGPLSTDLGTLKREFEDIQQVGIPAAAAAWAETIKESGDVSNYFGIDENSGLATWVNLGASVAFDPITWATLGGNASWSSLRVMMTTPQGIERALTTRMFRSAARQVAEGDVKVVKMIPILSSGGMESTEIARLVRIAATDYTDDAAGLLAAKVDAIDVFRTALNANYTPAGPGRLLTRKTTLGLAQVARIAHRDPKARSFLQDILIRASATKNVATTERGILNTLFDMAGVRRLNNVDGYADDILKFTDEFVEYTSGDATIGIAEGRAQVLRQELDDIGSMSDEISQVPRLRRTVTEWNDSIIELDARIARNAATREAAESSLPKLRAAVEKAQAELDRLKALANPDKPRVAAIATARADLTRASRALRNVADDTTRAAFETNRAAAIKARDEIQALLDSVDDVGLTVGQRYDTAVKEVARRRTELKSLEQQVSEIGFRDRSPLELMVHRYYDEWAEELGIPTLKNADGVTDARHALFPNELPQRDWSVVTGDSSSIVSREQAGRYAPFKDDAAKLEDIGFYVESGTTSLPVSVQELLAWNTMQRNAVSRATWKVMTETRVGAATKRFFDGLQTVFAVGVLFNPKTVFRSNLDEVVRFFEDQGMNASLLKSTLPVGKVGSEARAAQRAGSSFLPPRLAEWMMVDPKKTGMWQHAERWINGTIVHDKLFQGWARAFLSSTDDVARRAEWEKFWNETGSKLAKRSTLEGTPMTAGNSYDVINNAFSRWKGGIKDPALAQKVWDDMLEAASVGGQVKWEPRVFRQLPQVPAQTTGTKLAVTRPVESGFQALYGMPQARRGSVFYDRNFEWKLETLRQRHAGRIIGYDIDAEWLVRNGYAETTQRAEAMIAAGNRSEKVRDLVSQTGMVMDRDLRESAMNFAASSADDMMYTFGATSLFGKKVARIYPFGRAQVDYLQWWWKKLSEPTRFVGGAQAGAGALTALPSGNLRLIDRVGHLLNLREGMEEDERPGATTPAGIINNFTFLPSTLDENILTDIIPSLGPLPGWMLNAPWVKDLPGGEEIRGAMAQLHPAYARYTDPYESTSDWLAGFADVVFPSGSLSLRAEGAAAYNAVMLAGAYASLGFTPQQELSSDEQRRINSRYNVMIRNAGAGPWRNDYIKTNFASWMVEGDNIFRTVLDDDLNSEVMQEWASLNDQASLESLKESGMDFLGRIAGAAVYGGSDFSYVETLFPMVDILDALVESGSISDAKRDSVSLGAEAAQADDATASDRRLFADEALETLFTLMTRDERAEFIARNPGVTANLVSFRQVVDDLVPADVAEYVVDGKIRTNDLDKARELNARGEKEGWLVDKSDTAVELEMAYSAHRSFREFYDVIFRQATGFDISVSSVPDSSGRGRVSLKDQSFPLTPQWWDQYGGWLEQTGQFKLPDELKSQLVAGNTVPVSYEWFKSLTKSAKATYSYSFTGDNVLAAKMKRIGVDDRSPTAVGFALASVEGFDTRDFDQTKQLSYYGEDLLKFTEKALAEGQKNFGWTSFEEWETDTFTVMDDGPDGPVSVEYSLEDIKARWRVALALTSVNKDDRNMLVEKDYNNSWVGRQLGPLDWEPPEPPPLSGLTEDYFETSNMDQLHIVDGDTIEMQTPDGPAFIRLLGINSPEVGDEGYEQATRELVNIVRNAEKVQFVVWNPDTYGRRQTSFTRDSDGAVMQRDRLFVWLYVDGIPVYDPRVFTPTNIRGAGTGGVPTSLVQLREIQRRRLEASR